MKKSIQKGCTQRGSCFQKIIADKQAEETRKQIARMMKLAGQHYGVDKEIWLKRQAQLKQLRDKEDNE